MRRVALLVCGLLLTSCSWAFVTPPPAEPDDAGDCTDSRLAPVADTAFTAMMALTLLVAGSYCYREAQGGLEQNGTRAEPCGAGAYVGIGWTAVLGVASTVSAVSGFRDTRRCRARRVLQSLSASQP